MVIPLMYSLVLLTSQVSGSVPAAENQISPVVTEDWAVVADTPLSTTLHGWADRAGWKVVWESDADFRLAAAATVTGDFEMAAQKLLGSFRATQPRLKAVFYRGNRVLRIWAERAEP